MRIPVIAGNWKMNTTVNEAIKLVNEMCQELDMIASVDKIVCPPFVSLAAIGGLIKGHSLKLGAQNVYFEEKGAYTGEISPLMLADLCQFVIIGHSERRQYFTETGEVINKKIKAALKVGLKPILCVGERLEDNETGKTEDVITGQVKAALSGIDYSDTLMIAYEPIWAIGTGKAATGAQANETIGLIRCTFTALYGEKMGQNIRILYGGSVTPVNATEFMTQPEIDGALVGGASLKADQFMNIVKQAAVV